MINIINKEYLINHPNSIFVFGDNTLRKGKGGAASLRDLPNTYGFITKKYPDNKDSSFYKLDEYLFIYCQEIKYLIEYITSNKNKIFLISKIGSGLANRYNIFENIIEPSIKKDLKDFKNIEFLW